MSRHFSVNCIHAIVPLCIVQSIKCIMHICVVCIHAYYETECYGIPCVLCLVHRYKDAYYELREGRGSECSLVQTQYFSLCFWYKDDMRNFLLISVSHLEIDFQHHDMGITHKHCTMYRFSSYRCRCDALFSLDALLWSSAICQPLIVMQR